MQVDFTGLAIIRQRTPQVSIALTSLDPRWGRSIRALAMSSLNNSSKPMTPAAGLGQPSQAIAAWPHTAILCT